MNPNAINANLGQVSPVIQSTVTASAASKQAAGSGMLVLPQGQTIMLIPDRAPSEPILIPPLEALHHDSTSTMNVRVLPYIAGLPQDGLVIDQAILQAILVLKSEWHQRATSFAEARESKKKKKKNALDAITKAVFSEEKKEEKAEPLKIKSKKEKEKPPSSLTEAIISFFKHYIGW
ncbi:MAG TPA: hypothetical protein VN457_04075 [Chlamydiales bacterium]|nr:hypothetical protein [Chlamydiales bacterium]